MPLAPRPIANVILQTSTGVEITYDYGYFYPVNNLDQPQYFDPATPPSLIAGTTYAVNALTSGKHSVNESIITAQPGLFDMVLESEPLIQIKGEMPIDGTSDVHALIEFYRSDMLAAAFEYEGTELSMEIPAGTYDVRVSGISGHRFDASTSQYCSVLLEAYWQTQTFAGTSS